MTEQQTRTSDTPPRDEIDREARRTEVVARALASVAITDRDSFDSVTDPPRDIAGLYAYSQLDCLIELAYRVAKDFFARPHLYTELDDANLPENLARLASKVGTDEFFPSLEQREAMYRPVFGSDEDPRHKFVTNRNAVLTAAATFAEWGQATGIPSLRAAFNEVRVGFRAYLDSRAGASITWSRTKALRGIADDVAYPILRSKSIVAIFGLTKAPANEWPYIADADGDKAVEEISKRLREQGAPDVTAEGFIATQRVALRGAEALAAILDFNESDASDPEAVDALINRCYTWHTTLRARALPVGAALTPSTAALTPASVAVTPNGDATLAAAAGTSYGAAYGG
jgi:hypothetical protein